MGVRQQRCEQGTGAAGQTPGDVHRQCKQQTHNRAAALWSGQSGAEAANHKLNQKEVDMKK